MRTVTTLGMAAVLGLTVAACEAEPDVETDLEQPTITADTTTMDTRDTGIPAVQVDSLEDGGVYLTDANGRALYLLEGEPQDSASCYDACAEEWPPYLTSQENPTAGTAVQQNLIGTIERTDGQAAGQWQVTYAGHPLYYYHSDRGPGDTGGQDLTDDWGEWYLVTPEGEPLEDSDTDENGES